MAGKITVPAFAVKFPPHNSIRTAHSYCLIIQLNLYLADTLMKYKKQPSRDEVNIPSSTVTWIGANCISVSKW